MINLSLVKSKKTSRIKLQPLISRPTPHALQFTPQARELLFLSPQPKKSGLISGGSSPKQNAVALNFNDNLLKMDKLPERQIVEKRQTPPDIRKLEIDWKKISANETHIKELSSPQPITNRRTTRISTLITKNKVVGVPARYKSLNHSKTTRNPTEYRGSINDLELIKLHSKDDLNLRIEQAKARFLQISQNLPAGDLENNWRWKTPESSESENSNFIEN